MTEDFTAEEEKILTNLLERVQIILEETQVDRKATCVDNGFFYDYGSITNAWHSEPDVEYSSDWENELYLDNTKEVSDDILNALLEHLSCEHGRIVFVSSDEYDTTDHELDADWHWTREGDTVYLSPWR